MALFAPKYYQKFKCIADRCTHSCCVGWEIDVDGDTLEKYQALSGETGDRIRRSIATEGETAHFILRDDERCPHLTKSGLCEIISALGEGYLCEICREHPRFYNVVGDRTECGLGASCEEAARLILCEEDYAAIVPMQAAACTQNSETVADFDAKAWRAALYALLCNRTLPYHQRLALIEKKYAVPVRMSGKKQRALFASLEYLDEMHRSLFADCCGQIACPEGDAALFCERFLAYLVYRHASPEESEQGFRLGVGLALVLERLFRALLLRGLDPVRSAVMVSEELEYSEENTDAIRFALEMSELGMTTEKE